MVSLRPQLEMPSRKLSGYVSLELMKKIGLEGRHLGIISTYIDSKAMRIDECVEKE